MSDFRIKQRLVEIRRNAGDRSPHARDRLGLTFVGTVGVDAARYRRSRRLAC